MSEPSVTVTLDVNEYLNEGADRVDFVMTAKASGFSSASAREKVVVALIDRSGSMAENNGQKIAAARKAVLKLIEMLTPDTYFAVVAFSDVSTVVFPLSQANPQNKQRAHSAVEHLTAGGTTAMSEGIAAALEQFSKRPGADGTCIFLTDGQNDKGDNVLLDRVLQQVIELRQQGSVFQVQCRGVGTAWTVDQMRKIATATMGEPPCPVFDAAELEKDFAHCLESAMNTALSDVRVNLWLPQNVQVLEFKQVTPSLVRLSGNDKIGPDGQTHIFSLGAWENESREFYGALKIAPRPVGKKVAAGRVSLSYHFGTQDVTTQPQMIQIQWTDNQSLSARIPAGVARATGQVELAASIQEGVRAYDAGDIDVATQKFGRAVQLAKASGNEEMTTRLRGMVDIVDADAGTVRVKKASKEAVMDLDAASTRTVRAKR